MASINLVAIQSVPFPQAFLRMNGSGVTQPIGAGGGTVNCQYYAPGSLPVPSIGTFEVFELIPISTVPNSFGLRSVNFASAFLRIDGSRVTQPSGPGSGTVNCQFYLSGAYPTSSSDYELLIVEPVPGVTFENSPAYSIRSNLFPDVFLRMDGSSVVQPQGAGSGVVNCQFYPTGTTPNSASDYEVFNIVNLA
jgi:hypothetical protein